MAQKTQHEVGMPAVSRCQQHFYTCSWSSAGPSVSHLEGGLERLPLHHGKRKGCWSAHDTQRDAQRHVLSSLPQVNVVHSTHLCCKTLSCTPLCARDRCTGSRKCIRVPKWNIQEADMHRQGCGIESQAAASFTPDCHVFKMKIKMRNRNFARFL